MVPTLEEQLVESYATILLLVDCQENVAGKHVTKKGNISIRVYWA